MDVLLAAVEYLKENEVQGGTENEQPTGKKRATPDYNYDDEVKNLPFGLRNLQYGEFQEIDDVYLNSQKYLKRYESTREPATWYAMNTDPRPLLYTERARVKKFEKEWSTIVGTEFEKERQLFVSFATVLCPLKWVQKSVDRVRLALKWLWKIHKRRFQCNKDKIHEGYLNAYKTGMATMYRIMWINDEMRKRKLRSLHGEQFVYALKTYYPSLVDECVNCHAIVIGLAEFLTANNIKC